MGICCGPKCSKAFLILYNLVFWTSGCVCVALGVLLLIDPYYVNTFTLLTLQKYDSRIVQYVAFGAIGLGGFILFVGFFGCCGALQDSKAMLVIYTLSLFLVLILELGLGLISVYLHLYFPIELRTQVKDRIIHHYGTHGNEEFSLAVNYTQSEYMCCGIDTHSDYFTSWWRNESTRIQQNQMMGNTYGGYGNNRDAASGVPMKVPVTCCVQDHKVWIEQDRWLKPEPLNMFKCQKTEQPSEYIGFLHEEGCWVKVRDAFGLRNHILLAGAGILALLQVLGISVTVCVMRNVDTCEA